MSDAVGPGDLVLCVNAAPNHVTGRPVPLVAGETYRVVAVMEFACPCGRSDALLDVDVDFAWCQTRFRLLPKPKAQTKTRQVSAPQGEGDGSMNGWPGCGRAPTPRDERTGVNRPNAVSLERPHRQPSPRLPEGAEQGRHGERGQRGHQGGGDYGAD